MQRRELRERRDDHADELAFTTSGAGSFASSSTSAPVSVCAGEDAAAEREHLRVLRRVGERLRDGDGIALRLDERDRRRPFEQGEQRLRARLLGGATGERVLDDL